MTKNIRKIANKLNADGWLVNESPSGAEIVFVWFDEDDNVYFWQCGQWNKQRFETLDSIAARDEFQYADDGVPPWSVILLGAIIGFAIGVMTR